jgi:hypothetical protein
VVWGGQGLAPLDTGGLYDPIADHWTPISTAGAPTARSGHTAVWTGDRMLVWGGTAVAALDSGGLYSPASNTWSPVASAGVPAARSGHSAAWTGSRMVVWGGAGASYLDTGGRYDPIADAWAPTSMQGVPPGRVGQAAAWNGDSLLVWGGYNGKYLAGGGRYCACTPFTYYRDADGDGHGDPAFPFAACGAAPGYTADGTDCDDTDAGAWGTPSEVLEFAFADRDTLTWTVPASPGGLAVLYDVLRSGTRSDFVAPAVCLATDSAAPPAGDTERPLRGQVFFYLVRSQSRCAGGSGTLGTNSSGTPRAGRGCP